MKKINFIQEVKDLKKNLSRKVACLALSSAMAFTNVGTTLPVNLVKIANAEEVADILQKECV